MRAAALVLALLTAVCALTIARPAGTPGPPMRDFEAYYCAGATRNAGHDAYSRAIWQCESHVPGVNAAHDEVLPFIGPPPVLALFSLLARLPYDAARIVWYAVLVLCAGVVAFGAFSLTGRSIGALEIGALVVLCAGFAPLTSDVALGQVALVASAGIVIAVTAPRWLKALGFFAAGLQPNVGIAAAAELRDRSAWLPAVAAAIAAYAAGAWADGWAWPVRYLAHVRAHSYAEAGSRIQETIAGVAAGFGAAADQAAALQWVVTACAACISLFVIVRAKDTKQALPAVCALLPFTAAFFHEHDFTIVLVACIAAFAAQRATLAFCGAAVCAIDWLGLAQRPQALLQDALLCAAFLLCALALEPRAREWFSASAVTAVLFCGGALLGRAAPVAIWPDALGPFRAQPGASIAQLWREEQRRSHLLGAAPADATLRLMPFVGCALVALSLRYRRP